jgi:hypothetical protein
MNQTKQKVQQAERYTPAITSFFIDTPVKDISDELHKNGCALIQNALSEQYLNRLNAEFNFLLDENETTKSRPDEYFRLARTSLEQLQPENTPATCALFGSKWISEICESYFNSEKFLISHEIYVNQTHASSTRQRLKSDNPVFNLHFDTIPTLKFLLYLNDVGPNNGPFNCAPGTHHYTNEFRKDHLKKNVPYTEIPSLFDSTNYSKIPVFGKSGTFIIFCTDTLHAPQHVEIGYERRVMRSHCFSKKSFDVSGLEHPIKLL